MAFGFQPAGLFGRKAFGRKPLGEVALPGPISGFGGGTFNVDGTQATPVDRYPSEPMDQPDMQQAAKPQGLFGKIAGAAGNIGAILDDEPSPQEVERDRQRFAEQQYRARALAEQQQAAVKRDQDWQDYMRKYQFELEHPKPVNNDTINDVRWYMGASDAEREAYHKLHPQFQTIRNPDGTITVMPVSGFGAAPASAPPDVLPADFDFGGGGASNGTSTFRDAFADYLR